MNNIVIGFDSEYWIYILGLIWADGHVPYSKNYVEIASSGEDINIIEKVLYQVSPLWKKYNKKNKNLKWKNAVVFRLNCKTLVQKLVELDFRKKTKVAPIKLLQVIPVNLHYLFWRGYFDGDGTLKANKNGVCVSICAHVRQNWICVKKLFKVLQIDSFLLRKYKHKEFQCSKISLGNCLDCLRFLKFIYLNRHNDGIGLDRKYISYQNIEKFALDYLGKSFFTKPTHIRSTYILRTSNSKINILPSDKNFFEKKYLSHYITNTNLFKLIKILDQEDYYREYSKSLDQHNV